MEEHGRLSNLGLLQLVVGTGKHNISNLETENLIGLIKEFFCQRIVVIKVLTHSYELRTLTWENKCFHFLFYLFSLLQMLR